MNDDAAHQVLRDLLSYFESLETRTGAVLQFLKEKGIATDEQLAPSLEQAASAASVKWRAVRVRMEHLFALSERTSAEFAPKQASSEPPIKPESGAKQNAKQSETAREVLTKDAELQHGSSMEPANKSEAHAGAGNGPPCKDVVAKAPTQSPAPTGQKASGESKRSETEQQKAS